MQTLLCGGRYKKIECVFNSGGIQVYICNDVYEKNTYSPYILNVYHNKLFIKKYLPVIYDMESSLYADFRETHIGPDTLTTVFRYHAGEKPEEFFSKVSPADFETRSAYAKSFLEECMIFKLLPEDVANMVIKKDNFRVLPNNREIKVNFIMLPENTCKTVTELSYDILAEIFPKSRFLPEIIQDYLNDYRNGKFEDIAEAFSVYKQVLPQALSRYEELIRETNFAYGKRMLVSYLKRKFRRKRKG